MKNQTRTNSGIRAKEVRVVDSDGTQLGILSLSEALRKAQEAGLDLVEVSPNANPPVCKIIDWGKYNYQKTKQLQKSKKKQKSLDIKQIRMGLKIDDHDLDVKLRKVRSFLESGHKVKITLFFRGREMAHKELGYKLVDDIMKKLEDIAIIDQEPQMTGKHLNLVIRSTGNAKAKNS